MFYSVVTNALFICRVEKGVEESVDITELESLVRSLASRPVGAGGQIPSLQTNRFQTTVNNAEICAIPKVTSDCLRSLRVRFQIDFEYFRGFESTADIILNHLLPLI